MRNSIGYQYHDGFSWEPPWLSEIRTYQHDNNVELDVLCETQPAFSVEHFPELYSAAKERSNSTLQSSRTLGMKLSLNIFLRCM